MMVETLPPCTSKDRSQMWRETSSGNTCRIRIYSGITERDKSLNRQKKRYDQVIALILFKIGERDIHGQV